ncbi:TetR/AcrR family transcriptional regulator [Nocardioides ultimimeridianus]
MRTRWEPEKRREQLLRVAERVFAEQGYQGTSVNDVAAAAGVTRTLVYKYFRDTDELYLACVRAARAELEDRFATAALAQEDPGDQLRAGVTAYYEFVQDRSTLWDLLYGGGSAVAGGVAAEAAQLRYDTAERIAVLISAAMPELPAETASATAHAVSGACEQLAKWWRRHPEMALETVVEHLMATVWGGMEALART